MSLLASAQTGVGDEAGMTPLTAEKPSELLKAAPLFLEFFSDTAYCHIKALACAAAAGSTNFFR